MQGHDVLQSVAYQCKLSMSSNLCYGKESLRDLKLLKHVQNWFYHLLKNVKMRTVGVVSL